MAIHKYKDNNELKQLYKKASEPVKISTLLELKMLLGTLLGKIKSTNVSMQTTVDWTDEKGKKCSAQVIADSTNGSLRDTLMDGMIVVKNRIMSFDKVREAITVAKKNEDISDVNMQIWDISNIRFNVDTLIEKRLGGKRHGARIRWKLVEGVFEFDPFSNKLYEVDDESTKDGHGRA